MFKINKYLACKITKNKTLCNDADLGNITNDGTKTEISLMRFEKKKLFRICKNVTTKFAF